MFQIAYFKRIFSIFSLSGRISSEKMANCIPENIFKAKIVLSSDFVSNYLSKQQNCIEERANKKKSEIEEKRAVKTITTVPSCSQPVALRTRKNTATLISDRVDVNTQSEFIPANIYQCRVMLNRNFVSSYLSKQQSLNEERAIKKSQTIKTIIEASSCNEAVAHRTRKQTAARITDRQAKIDEQLTHENLKRKHETAISIPKAKRAKVAPRKTRAKSVRVMNALMPAFHVFELVWGYVRGYPSWPGVIESISPKGKMVIHFFGDYTKAELNRNAITHFFEGFNQFERHFGNVKLQKAVAEARIFLLDSGRDSNECYVCKILMLKKQLYARK